MSEDSNSHQSIEQNNQNFFYNNSNYQDTQSSSSSNRNTMNLEDNSVEVFLKFFKNKILQTYSKLNITTDNSRSF